MIPAIGVDNPAPLWFTGPMTTSAQTTAAKYDTHTFGALSIIGWRRSYDGVARFTLWNEETILPNVDWQSAWAFIANRVHHVPSIERVLRDALALNEGR